MRGDLKERALSSRDLRIADVAQVCPVGFIAAGRNAWVLSAETDEGSVILKVATETTMADPIGRARFAREGQVGLTLSHPRLVQTIRCGSDWIVLKYHGEREKEAQNFLDFVRGTGPLAADEVQRRIAAIAQALAYMHARGVVHRDVKPGNILSDGCGRPVLIDLGAAGLVAGTDLDTAELIGSPAWMAPEQLRACPAHASADVWSLAMVAVFALTGVSFEGSADDVMRRRLAGLHVSTALVERACSAASAAFADLLKPALSVDARLRPPARAFGRLASGR